MKKLSTILLALAICSSAHAVSYLPPRPVIINHYHTRTEDNTARNMAAVAIGVGVIAILIGISASENNRGQYRIARF